MAWNLMWAEYWGSYQRFDFVKGKKTFVFGFVTQQFLELSDILTTRIIKKKYICKML